MISEDAFMDNLKLRYQKDRIYVSLYPKIMCYFLFLISLDLCQQTYIGEVVVSVNPYKSMNDLYSPKKIQEYRGRQMYEVPPHM